MSSLSYEDLINNSNDKKLFSGDFRENLRIYLKNLGKKLKLVIN